MQRWDSVGEGRVHNERTAVATGCTCFCVPIVVVQRVAKPVYGFAVTPTHTSCRASDHTIYHQNNTPDRASSRERPRETQKVHTYLLSRRR